MKPILRSYFYRLFREKAFYIELGILFGLSLIIASLVRGVAYANGEDIGFERAVLTAFTGGQLMGTASIPWLNLFFFVIFGAVRYRKETASGALRNYIVSGYSRKQIYNALYIGNMVFYLFLTASIALGVILPFIGAPNGLSGDAVGSFLAAIGLSFLVQFAFATFVYFSFVLMQGHGFSGTFGILVYVGLSLICSIIVLVVSFNMTSITVDVGKGVLRGIGFLPNSVLGAFSSGKLSGAPQGGLLPLILVDPSSEAGQQAMATMQAVNGADYTVSNVISAFVSIALFGVGSYLLGMRINSRRDLK